MPFSFLKPGAARARGALAVMDGSARRVTATDWRGVAARAGGGGEQTRPTTATSQAGCFGAIGVLYDEA